MTLAYAVIFVFALLGNSFGLFVVLKKSSPVGRITSLFIANMAAADLLLTCTVMPYQVAYFYRGGTWFGGAFGTATCKLFSYVVTVSIAATVLTMLVISIDRFHAIFYPLKRRLFRKPKILSTIVWLLSLILMIPYPLYSVVELNTGQNAYKCSQLSSKTDQDVIRSSMFVFLLPFMHYLFSFWFCFIFWSAESCGFAKSQETCRVTVELLLTDLNARLRGCWS